MVDMVFSSGVRYSNLGIKAVLYFLKEGGQLNGGT